MSAIADNIRYFQSTLPENVTLVAVSKTKSIAEILEAYEAGQRAFGENKVQELIPKYESLPKDIEWHFIGHLQSNKVKYIAPFISYIHSVDSLNLLTEINKEAHKSNRLIKCLLEMHIALEETKFGCNKLGINSILGTPEIKNFQNINIVGLMGMATYCDDMDHVRKEFQSLSEMFNEIKSKYFAKDQYFCEKSMGMSSDYNVAINEGSTMLRIGSIIFGERIYNKNKTTLL